MNRYTWEGHTIDVRFVLQARIGWLGGGFVVRVDERDEFHPPKVFEGRGTTTRFQIDHNGRTLGGTVRSVGRVIALGTRYELNVDGLPIANGRARAENWFILYSILVGLLVVLANLLVILLWQMLG